MLAIRPYEPGDLEACRRLWEELTEWHRFLYASPSIGGEDPGRKFDEHLARVGPQRIWVAEADGDVVGLAGLILEEGAAELEPVVVTERMRGRGIGRKLAQTVIERAREQGVRQLEVRPVARNADAIRFFHRLGFDVLGQLELLLDLGPADRQVWRSGELIADRQFRV